MGLLIKVLVLLWAVNAEVQSNTIICRLGYYDDPICILQKNLSPEVYNSECCLELSSYLKSSDICPDYLNFESLSNYSLNLHECDESSNIYILSKSPNHQPRSLLKQCSSLSEVYSKSALQYPVILSNRLNTSTITNFSKYNISQYASNYKYTASTSVNNRATSYQVIGLRLGSLNRKCYGNADLTGIALIDDYSTDTIILSDVSGISCSFIGYYIPEDNESFSVTIQMDANIQIWIGESVNIASPSSSCSSGQICSFDIIPTSGRVYQVHIAAKKSGSNTIYIMKLTISSTQYLYNQIFSEPFSYLNCTGSFSLRENREFNGLYLCPMNVYKCNAMDSENRYYSALIPKYCLNYSWNDNIFSCTRCILNSHLEKGLCVCDAGFAENHITGECLATSYKLETILDTSNFDTALLIVTNPCTQVDNNFFCKETGTSDLLYKPIITEFTLKDGLNLSASAYLTDGAYSITINYLKRGGLLRECWAGWNNIGYRTVSGIGDISIPPNMNACVYEGFIKAPESDINLIISVDNMLFIWIEDYSNLCSIAYIRTSNIIYYPFIKDSLYYIRIDYYNTGGIASIGIRWQSADSTVARNVTTDILYYPTRPFWNINHINTIEDSLEIVNDSIDKGVYYCPYICRTCEVRLNGEYECLSCRNNLQLLNGECGCESNEGFDSVKYECIVCPELTKSCDYEDRELVHLECIDNSMKYLNSCICNLNFYHFEGKCLETDCRLNLPFMNTNLDDITILDLIWYCNTPNCEVDRFRRIERYKDHANTIGIINDTQYSLAISNLERGYLQYTYFPTDFTQDSSTDIEKATLDQDLSSYTDGKARYQGYFSIPNTGEYTFIIDTNTQFRIYFTDDSISEYTTESAEFIGYFTQNKFYYIRIDIALIRNTYFNILAIRDGVPSKPNFYYAYKSENSPILISSCKASYLFDYRDIVTGIQFCPDLCIKCIQTISIYESTPYDKICIECLEFSELIYDRCECIEEYSFDSITKTCQSYTIPYCISYDQNLNCNKCKSNFKLLNNECVCDIEYYKLKDEACVKRSLKLSIQPFTNSIQLVFDNQLKDHLDQNSIELTFYDDEIDAQVSYKLEEVIEYEIYSYEFRYPENIDSNVIIYILFLTNITDITDSTLEYNYYEAQTHLLFNYDSSSNGNTTHEDSHLNDTFNDTHISEVQVETIKHTALYSSLAMIGASMLASIINLNPSSFLRMINTLQIYKYLLLLNVSLPERVKAICQGFDPLGFIPNILVRYLDTSGNQMNQKYRDFGVETSDFIINIGKQSFILAICIFIYLILRICWKYRHYRVDYQILNRIMSKLLSIFEYGIFIGI